MLRVNHAPRRRRSLARLALPGLVAALVLWYLWIAIAGSARPVQATLPPMPPPRPGETILVFAPHEDDETVGVAGYLRKAVARGAGVHVCLMTAGEGEELGAVLVNRRPRVTPRGYVRLGQVRHRESLRALAMIGLPPSHVVFLNYPNMGLKPLYGAANWSDTALWTSPFTRTDHSPFDNSFTPGAPFCGSAVVRDVQQILRRVRPTAVFVVHPADTHSDHWTTYAFVRLALENLRLRERPDWLHTCRLYTYLVHRRGWPVPWGYYPDLQLMPPAPLLPLAVNRWLTLPLDEEEVRVKNRMILAYRSQLTRFDLMLRAFARRTEVFAELVDVSLAPGQPPRRSLFAEPVADSRYLRDRPSADLAEVALSTDGRALEIRARTRATLTPRVRLTVLLHLAASAPGALQVLQIEYRQGQPTTVLGAGRDAGPTPLPELAGCAISGGDTALITIPYSYLGSGQPVLLDVLTQVGRRVVDHSITRAVTMPQAP